MKAEQVRLVAESGGAMAVLLPLLFAGLGFEVVDAPTAPTVPPVGLFESLPGAVRERALAWERHVREVETGRSEGVDSEGPVRVEYDPESRMLAQCEEAKAAELSAAGVRASAVTVRRMRARCRDAGVWGLVDRRTTRMRSPLGRTEERVVSALQEVLDAGQERSSGALGRFRVYTEWLLTERHGAGVVALLSTATFHRLVHAVAEGMGAAGGGEAAGVALGASGSSFFADGGVGSWEAGDVGQYAVGCLRGAG